MATLDTLIKLSSRKLEEQQKLIADLERLLSQLSQQQIQLQKQVEDGFDVAEKATDPQSYQQASSFLERARQESDVLVKRERKIQEQKKQALEEVRTLFAEKKRYEVLLEQKQVEAKKARLKKEQEKLEDLTNR